MSTIMAAPSKQLVNDVQKATGLDDRKTKALTGQLICSVYTVTRNIHEPTAKVKLHMYAITLRCICNAWFDGMMV